MRRPIGILAVLAVLALLALPSGCGDAAAARDADAGAERADPPAAGAGEAAPSGFTATIAGDVDRRLEGGGVSGARYGRYHINLASDRATGPVVVIAFGRTDTSTPAPGTYGLGGRDAAFPGGSVEIYGDPQREFDIVAGEMEITGASGDALTGSFRVTARERPEEYGGPSPEIRVEGTFATRPAS
jgi:hypothetical protein